MADATVTIDYVQFQDIQNKRAEAERRVAELEKEIAQLKMAPAAVEGGLVNVGRLVVLVRELMKVACFAVGNLPPEVTKNWPTTSLTTAANLLKELPDHSTADQELAIEWCSFAREAERFEQRRQMLKGQIGV